MDLLVNPVMGVAQSDMSLRSLGGAVHTGFSDAMNGRLYSISSLLNTFIVGAVRAAEELLITLDAMPDDSATTVEARWSKSLDCALKAVEGVAFVLVDYIEGFVVCVVADSTDAHAEAPKNNLTYLTARP